MVYLLEFLLSSDLCQFDCPREDFTLNITVKCTGCVPQPLGGGGRARSGTVSKPHHSQVSRQRLSQAPASSSLLATGPLLSTLGDAESKGK